MNHTDSKIALRRHFRAARRAFFASLSLEARGALESQLAALLAPLLAAAQAPASYAAEKSEIDASRLRGLAFPRISGADLVFHRSTRDALTPGHGGIFEPATTAPRVTPDLLLVPLLAATPDGRRLGQGGGFYDRTLRQLRSEGAVTAIGIGWDVQITDDLPTDPWDEPLDYIATPSRLVDCARFG